MRRMLLALVLAGLGFLAGLAWPRRVMEGAVIPSTLAQVQPAAQGGRPAPVRRPELAEEERATIGLFQRASPSVVYITSLAVQRDFFSMRAQEVPQGSGSGFLWDRQGHVVTNFHVIESASGAQVTLSDQSTWDAELVGTAPEKDLAVLRIKAPASKLQPLPIGESDDLQVGQSVFAIGNPFGLDQTLTTGIVSALGREIQSVAGVPIRDVIQTDAAINPGNSGGPLLDSAGRLIGINTAIYSPSGAYAGIGFAIPVHSVAWVVPDLIRYGYVNRPTLGVELVPDSWNRQLGVEQGAVIMNVTPGSGADRAGLRGTERTRGRRVQLGDVIQTIDGKPIQSLADMFQVLEQKKAGDVVRVAFLRDGRKEEAQVRLDPAARQRP
ncbi:MAG: trypsin-like peptidase domain-containing protein [Acidobacteriota bacterium]